jgi:polysaccharide pyruvyl transferase WcaK-like protein
MTVAPRVALFGLLGSGNIGNHGSFDAMLQYLRSSHPDASLTCVCADPSEVQRVYGIRSIPINWYRSGGAVWKLVGKVLDVFRTLRWVRRHDVVIVPGMGVLEATLPIRPWGFPYALFLVSFWGRLCGTEVALVSVGANVVRQPVTRLLFRYAARLASYRSFRDEPSRDAIGLGDPVYPDLAFALPSPPAVPVEPRTVGVGVMAYHGTHLDRHRADEIHAAYVAKLTAFVRWLVDEGYKVRLFTGDPADEEVVAAVTAEVPATPVLTASLDELMREMAPVETVVASRYHNVLAALKLAKPTISISYASKNDVLMEEMGLGAYCQPIPALDTDLLIEQFRALRTDHAALRQEMLDRNDRNEQLLQAQNAVLSAKLF